MGYAAAPVTALSDLSTRDGFEALYREYAPRVRRLLVRRFGHNPPLCDDLTQEVFLRAYRARDRFDTSLPVWPWLKVITTNVAIDERRRPAHERECGSDDISLTAGSTPDDLFERFLAKERTKALAAALDTLPLRSRRLVVLKDAAGVPYEELADGDGVTVHALRCAVSRARQALRESYASELALRRLAALVAPFGRLLGPRFARLRSRVESAALPSTTETIVAVVRTGGSAAASAVFLGVMALVPGMEHAPVPAAATSGTPSPMTVTSVPVTVTSAPPAPAPQTVSPRGGDAALPNASLPAAPALAGPVGITPGDGHVAYDPARGVTGFTRAATGVDLGGGTP
jgi:RNA polymerase sigma-70 factor (ECF subfamily)